MVRKRSQIVSCLTDLGSKAVHGINPRATLLGSSDWKQKNSRSQTCFELESSSTKMANLADLESSSPVDE